MAVSRGGAIITTPGSSWTSAGRAAMPACARRVPATARASFAFYNTREDIDRLVKALIKTADLFA